MRDDPMPTPPRPHWSTFELGGHACELFAPPDPRSGRALVYLPYGALPEGRYVLSSGGEVRLLVVGKATGVTGPRPAADAATPPAEPAVTP